MLPSLPCILSMKVQLREGAAFGLGAVPYTLGAKPGFFVLGDVWHTTSGFRTRHHFENYDVKGAWQCSAHIRCKCHP